MNLTHDNLIIIYTSIFLDTESNQEEEKEENVEKIVNEIASFYENWKICRMDLTPRNDIVAALEFPQTAQAIMDAGKITIATLKGAVEIPVGPVVEPGAANYKRYSLRCNPPLTLSIEEIEEYLNQQGMQVREIIVENKYNLPFSYGGIQIYATFPTLRLAMDFKKEHDINGCEVRFRHIGQFKCEK